MRFANPSAFQLFWLIPICLVIAYVFERRTRGLIQKAFGKKIAPFLTSSVSRPLRLAKLLLKMAALACFITALAQPQLGKSLQEVKSTGIEIMIAVDVSNSMLAEDVKPSRLAFAKSEIERLLNTLSGDKVGLIAFAGSSVLISPLTNDKSALMMFVDSLSTLSVETQGTNFRRAMDEASEAFQRGGSESDEQLRVSRVILIMSDGEDQEIGAIEEARRLSGEGTRIFTVAFGTERGAPVPVRDERGFLRGYKRDQSGQNVLSVVKGDFLRQLAQAGKGSFHHASFGVDQAKQLKAEFDRLEKAEFSSSLATNYDEKFQIPLAIGLVLALIDLFLGEKRKTGRIWRGRFEVAQS